MASQLSWLQTVSKLSLPILTSCQSLPKANATYTQWVQCIEQDPVLALHLFNHTNKILKKNQTQATKLSHVISLLGTKKINQIADKLPKVDKQDASQLSLFQLVADAQVATHLLNSCLHHKGFQLDEQAYWQSIFHYVGHWPLTLLNYKQWQKQDVQLQNISQFNQRSSSITRIEANRWQQSIAKYFLLPHCQKKLIIDLSPTQPLFFKQAYFEALLPYCHLLALISRKNQSFIQQHSCYSWLQKKLGINYFPGFLKMHLAQAARQIKNPYASYPIKQLFKYPQINHKKLSSNSITPSQGDSALFKRLYVKMFKQPIHKITKQQLIHDCLQGCCLGLGLKQATFFNIRKTQMVCVANQQGQYTVQSDFHCAIDSCKILRQLTLKSGQRYFTPNRAPSLPLVFLQTFDSPRFLLISVCRPHQCMGIFYFDLAQTPLNSDKKKRAFDLFVQKVSERLISL